MKTVALVISGRGEGDNFQELEIHEGTTTADILSKTGLGDGYVLRLEGSPTPFATQEQLYSQLVDGGKLRAVPIMDVGYARERMYVA